MDKACVKLIDTEKNTVQSKLEARYQISLKTPRYLGDFFGGQVHISSCFEKQ